MPRALWFRFSVAVLGALLAVGPVVPGAFAAPQVDTDGDGVPDAGDACPNEPGVRSSDPRTAGCAPKLDAAKLKTKAEVTFTGYESLPGQRGRVFVELTDAVVVEVKRVGQVIEYKLIGATVPLKNNRNPLLLGDFGASALRAELVVPKQTKRRRVQSEPNSVRLVITLRGNVSPSHRMVTRERGAMLEVELPPLPPGN